LDRGSISQFKLPHTCIEHGESLKMTIVTVM
jgi:hypothetical protein